MTIVILGVVTIVENTKMLMPAVFLQLFYSGLYVQSKTLSYVF